MQDASGFKSLSFFHLFILSILIPLFSCYPYCFFANTFNLLLIVFNLAPDLNDWISMRLAPRLTGEAGFARVRGDMETAWHTTHSAVLNLPRTTTRDWSEKLSLRHWRTAYVTAHGHTFIDVDGEYRYCIWMHGCVMVMHVDMLCLHTQMLCFLAAV